MADSRRDGLVALDARWQLWETIMLRSAGFPIAGVLELADPDAAAAADAVLDRAKAERAARERAIAELEQRGDDRKLLHQLRAGSVPARADPALRAAHAAVVDARRELERVFESAARRTTAVLAAVAAQPRFREAVLWQNSQAFRRAVTAVGGETLNARERQRQQLVASYWQRYCTKNETIGFFGPIGWASCGSDSAIEVTPGPALLASQDVYFEHWGIDAVANALVADVDLLCDLPPRLMPAVRVEGTWLHAGAAPPAPLPAVVARLLAACDGERSARAIAVELVGDELESEEDVYDLLQQLVARRVVTWTLELPSGVLEPERRLRELLERVAPSAARTRALAAVARIADVRDRVAAAAGHPAALERALGDLDTMFTELTHAAPTRRAGEAYGGRTLVITECRRDVTLRLGRPLLDRLAPALSLVLTSGRWYAHQIGQRYRALLDAAHRELAERGPVHCAHWWDRIASHFEVRTGERLPLVEEVVREVQRRWEALLALPADQRRVTLRADQLAPRVAVAFAGPEPGWPNARHLSPDVMIAARDVAAIERGELLFVLGEVHIGNTVFDTAHLHPDPGPLVAAFERDIREPQIAPVDRREAVPLTRRAALLERDFHLEVGASRSFRPRNRVLRIADLVVERAGERLEVVDPRRALRFDAIAFVSQYLSYVASSHFKWAPHLPYTPRVTIDDVVVIREHWSCERDELGFAHASHAAERFAGARAWARHHGFPRWVFARVAEEMKPIFVDFDSPALVELLAKRLRGTSVVTVTEMLPDPEHVWLPDHAGATYTCELRLAAVDGSSS